jgi:hypothetical protein
MKTPLKVLLPLLLLTLPAVVQAQDFIWTTNVDGTLNIAGYIGTNTVVTIPSMTNDLTVTSIGENAFSPFSGNTGPSSVTIPETVTGIGVGAFYEDLSLTNVTIPDSVTTIGDMAFEGCTSLTSVTIGRHVTSMGNAVFISCIRLTNVTIGTNVVSIGISAFKWCSSLTNVTIPYSVTNIGEYAFYDCSSLTSVAIGNSVTTIAPYAFEGCTSLTSVTIPSSVSVIGEVAFAGCTSLTAITVDASNSYYSSVNGVLFDKSQSTLLQYPEGLGGSYTTLNSVTRVLDFAFADCRRLTNVVIGSSVTNIGDYTFSDCTGLTGVYFNGNVPNGSLVFYGIAPVNATVYYLPGTTGWTNPWQGRPTALWFLPNPLILSNPSFGVQTNQFGFIISWATNIPVVVEACTNLTNLSWSPVSTNILTSGSSYFRDSQCTNYPACLYRLRSP